MGANISLSTACLTAFEIINELFIAAGSGIAGLCILIQHGISTQQVIRTFIVSSVTVASLIYAFQFTDSAKPSPEKVILISGCDSGVGFSLACHLCEAGFTVLAACLKLDSGGAKLLQSSYGEKIQLIELDITQSLSVRTAFDVVERFLNSDEQYQNFAKLYKHFQGLWAIINNAGVMVFGEFEWLTERLIQHQLDVNLGGTFRFTKAFCPLLRKYKGRIITISSHCAEATLPGLAVYGATKAGLSAWSDGLRVELKKYGVSVVTFIPGSFVQQSNIMARQVDNSYEMHVAFSEEQKDFYCDYFKRYNSYLSLIAGPKLPQRIDDRMLYTVFDKAVLEQSPKAVYKVEPFRYSMYHTVFRYSPVSVRDYFILKFMDMPQYNESRNLVPV